MLVPPMLADGAGRIFQRLLVAFDQLTHSQRLHSLIGFAVPRLALFNNFPPTHSTFRAGGVAFSPQRVIPLQAIDCLRLRP